MFSRKKWIGFLLFFVLFSSTVWGDTFEEEQKFLNSLDGQKAESSFVGDFAVSPFPMARSYMTGYLSTVDSRTLPPGVWKSGIVNLMTFWSYKIFNNNIDNNFADSVFAWGVGLYKGVEVNVALPFRYYYNTQINSQRIDVAQQVSLFDSSVSLKAVFSSKLATVGLGITETFPLGASKDGFGSDQLTTKIMGIFSWTPFKSASIDVNMGYYFAGNGGKKSTFLFEGLTFNVGMSLKIKGFEVYGQVEYWNPFVPVNSSNDRLMAAFGVKLPTTETGAVFVGLGLSMSSPTLVPSIKTLPSSGSYSESRYLYLHISFIEHW